MSSLSCVKQAAVLLLLAPDAPAVNLGEDAGDMSEDEQRKQVVAALVGEIVLCVKEVNQKTRAAAYGLLVDLGQAMQDAQPPPMPDLDAHMAGMELQGKACLLPGHLPIASVCALTSADDKDCTVQARGPVDEGSLAAGLDEESGPAASCLASSVRC